MLIRSLKLSLCLIVSVSFATSVTHAQEADAKVAAESAGPAAAADAKADAEPDADAQAKSDAEPTGAEKPAGEEKHDTEGTDAEGADAVHAKGGDSAGHHGHIGAKGVNKAPEEVRQDLAIFTFLVFCGLMAVLSKFAWGPITEALDNRESKIRQDITDAETAKLKSQRLMGEHEAKLADVQEEVKGIIAEARRDAESTKTDILAAANQEADATRQRANDDIDHAKDLALKELFDSLSSRITGATEHVLGRSVTDQDHERLIEEALTQFSAGAGNNS